jgi:hypothetical protein
MVMNFAFILQYYHAWRGANDETLPKKIGIDPEF